MKETRCSKERMVCQTQPRQRKREQPNELEKLEDIYLLLSRSVSGDSGRALLIPSTSGRSWELSSSRVHSSWIVRQDVQPANSRGHCDIQDEPSSSNNIGVCQEMGSRWSLSVSWSRGRFTKYYDPILFSLWSLGKEVI